MALEYKTQSLAVHRDESDHSACDAADHLCKYMFSVPYCMDSFNQYPFTEWTGVDLSVNPLVTKTKLNGESSIISPRREGIASIQRLANGTMEYGNYASTVLDLDDKEAGQCKYVNDMLWYIVQQRAALGDDLSSYVRSELVTPQKDHLRGLIDTEKRSNSADESAEPPDMDSDTDTDADADQAHASKSALNIDGLMTRTAESINRALKHSRDKKLLLLGKTRKAALFRAWKRVYKSELTVLDATLLRDTRNLRQCFDSLRVNHWRCVKFRGIQENSHRRVVHEILTAWKAVLQFCQKVHKHF